MAVTTYINRIKLLPIRHRSCFLWFLYNHVVVAKWSSVSLFLPWALSVRICS